MKLASLFSDHAVLQREISVPVWGWTKPLVRVRVSLGAFTSETLSGVEGDFFTRLPPMPAGGPFELRVSVDGETSESFSAKDIWVGEVWLASGQSNMEWTMTQCGEKSADDIQHSRLPGLRMITIPRSANLGHPRDVEAKWLVSSEKTAGFYSATAFYFARKIHAELGVAVGILHSSWGGTFIEAWTDRSTLVANPDLKDWVARYEVTLNNPERWKPAAANRTYPVDSGNAGEEKNWQASDFNDTPWSEMTLPQTWQSAGHMHSGIFWFRKTVVVPKEWAGKDLELELGAIDKQDTTYFNGAKIGATGKGLEETHWNALRRYKIAGNLVKVGPNVVAVRVYSFVYHGGLIGPASEMKLALSEKEALPLHGAWRFQIEEDFGNVLPIAPPPGPGSPNSPHILFDNMIAPLVSYAIRGALWYQGESNAGNAAKYRRMLADLITSWRHVWGQGDFAFLTVQLANYMNPMPYQATSTWAFLREAQTQSLELANTGLAVAIDIGEATDIHPKNKKDVGERLAQWALAKTYGKPVVPSGPIFSELAIEGSRIRLRFKNIGKGLHAKGGPLKTFVVAGLDKNFQEARAEIEGDAIVVQSERVAEPVAVRYAWADNPLGSNLYNADGFPASPFRTDTW